MPVASRGFDGEKKANGRNRHTVVDALGLLPAEMVTAVSVTDREAGWMLPERLRMRHWRISLVWADGGYTGVRMGAGSECGTSEAHPSPSRRRAEPHGPIASRRGVRGGSLGTRLLTSPRWSYIHALHV